MQAGSFFFFFFLSYLELLKIKKEKKRVKTKQNAASYTRMYIPCQGSISVLLLLLIYIRWAVLHCWEFLYLNLNKGKYEKQ